MTEPEPTDEGIAECYLNFPKASPLDQLMVCDVCHDQKATHRIVYRAVVLDQTNESEIKHSIDGLVCPRCAKIIFDCWNHMKAAMRRDGIEVIDDD